MLHHPQPDIQVPSCHGDRTTPVQNQRTGRHRATCLAFLELCRLAETAIGAEQGFLPEIAMLADLYMARLDDRHLCAWEVSTVTRIPSSTAYRKIGHLTIDGLIDRLPLTGDRRRVPLALTERAVAMIDELMDRLEPLLTPRQ